MGIEFCCSCFWRVVDEDEHRCFDKCNLSLQEVKYDFKCPHWESRTTETRHRHMPVDDVIKEVLENVNGNSKE